MPQAGDTIHITDIPDRCAYAVATDDVELAHVLAVDITIEMISTVGFEDGLLQQAEALRDDWGLSAHAQLLAAYRFDV